MAWFGGVWRRMRQKQADRSAAAAFATREVARDTLDPSAISYQPDIDGAPDPGEVVWTWVPFEEGDGRGKDRPVLILVRESAVLFLGMYLTSHDHDGDPDYVSVGPGAWDAQGRPSWVNTSRLFRIHERGMRREGAALSRDAFERVVVALQR